MAVIPPLLRAILTEATRIAPHRSRASDGTVGDAAHQARKSDHNPDERGVVHAVDVTHDPHGGFDARAYAEVVRQRCESGEEDRVKYVVSHSAAKGHDIIASPTREFYLFGKRWQWRDKSGSAHANHLHISILSGTSIENSTAPIFGDSVPSKPPPAPSPSPIPLASDEEDDMLLIEHPRDLYEANPNRKYNSTRPPVAELRRKDAKVVLYNGASLAYDQQVFHVRVLDVSVAAEHAPIVGWKEDVMDGRKGVKIVNGLGMAYFWAWS